MLKKALITSVLATVALSTNGAGPVSAVGEWSQVNRPIPSVSTNADNGILPGDNGDEIREEFHQTYPLSATGRVSLENINGGVQVKVWDRAAVQVDAVKKAYRRDRLNEAKIDVNSTEDNIRIKTEYPDWNQTFRGDEGRVNNPAVVDYVLTVPRKVSLESIELINGPIDIESVEGNVKASSVNGRLTSRGLTGDAKLSTINGQLHATFSRLDPERTISLGSVNGSLIVVIPSDSNATIKAGTVHGGITNNFGIQVKHGEWVGHSLEGQIGSGGPKIKLGNVNGSIKISHAEDGKPVSVAVSLASAKTDAPDGSDEVDVVMAITQATEVVVEATRNIKVKIDTTKEIREARELQREAQRQVDAEIQKSQREMERAQRQLEREQTRELARLTRVKTNSGSGSGSNNYNRFTSKESKSFSVSGAPRVTLTTFDGSVVVHGWDKSEVMYTASKSASSEEDMKAITIQSEQHGSSVSVSAMSTDNHSGNVDLDVYVPRNATLHVSSDDGGLKLQGVSGDIVMRTGDGTIQVSEGSGTLQLNTGDGSIQVQKFDGSLDARTGDGPITLDGNFSDLAARTGDGAISLTVPQNSNFTVETNENDDFRNEGLSVTEDVTPSRRARRWRVGNGGKVFVLKTGDGRISLRSR